MPRRQVLNTGSGKKLEMRNDDSSTTLRFTLKLRNLICKCVPYLCSRYMRTYHTPCRTWNCLTEETLWLLSINISFKMCHPRNTTFLTPEMILLLSNTVLCFSNMLSLQRSGVYWISEWKCCLWGFQFIMFSLTYPIRREQNQLV